MGVPVYTSPTLSVDPAGKTGHQKVVGGWCDQAING